MLTKTSKKSLEPEQAKPSKAKICVIKDRCKGCAFCIEFCPQKVLEASEEMNSRGVHVPKVVNESKCTLCDLCSAICPDFAIFTIEKDCEGEC